MGINEVKKLISLVAAIKGEKMAKKEIPLKKEITVRLKPDIAERLSEFQGNYLISVKKRISQSDVVNMALEYFINETYKQWEILKRKAKNGK